MRINNQLQNYSLFMFSLLDNQSFPLKLPLLSQPILNVSLLNDAMGNVLTTTLGLVAGYGLAR